MAGKVAAAEPAPVDEMAAGSADHIRPPEPVVEPAREPDRVAVVSLRADGTPDQAEGFEVLGE